MIKAGALFYAIVISLIIAITSSALILSAYLSRIQYENFEIKRQLDLNADSGIKLLLSKQSLVELNQEKTIDLFNKGIDSVILIRKLWGAYEIVISKAIFKNSTSVRTAQVGFYQDNDHLYSLHLSDKDKPLALCGNTLIKGPAFLPKAGVKRAYIEGQSFSRSLLIEGEIKQSDRTLPKFNSELIENIKTVFFNKSITNNDSVLNIKSELTGDSLNNSFENKTLVFSSSVPIIISGGMYSGNIAVISDKQITVTSSALLKDVLLFAPKIIIEKKFRGNVQVFASDSISIGEEVTLTYPSVIGLISNKPTSTSIIVLSKKDTIMGSVFIIKNENDIMGQTRLLISEEAVIFGQVYSNGYVDLKGTINGSLMCDNIMLSTASSVYENHLLNAVIDVSKLPEHYTGINLVEESTVKKIVKWLN
jgi:cytoskeletal protein CcmA (bactofilin family)